MTIQTFVITDHLLTLRGARTILEDDPDIEIEGASGDLREARKDIQEHSPDVVVLDAETVRDSTRIDAVEDLKQACPSAEVMTLLSPRDTLLTRGLVEAGARGCLVKTDEYVLFLDEAVRCVNRGESVYSHSTLEAQLGRTYPLTPLELEVLRSLCRGKTNKGIAAELGLSPGTVQDHLSSIYDKLEAPTGTMWNRRVYAVVKAEELGL